MVARTVFFEKRMPILHTIMQYLHFPIAGGVRFFTETIGRS
jgi:hypothetical protein